MKTIRLTKQDCTLLENALASAIENESASADACKSDRIDTVTGTLVPYVHPANRATVRRCERVISQWQSLLAKIQAVSHD